ncbi:TonB-dependent receptor [Leptospira bouyouniensis]|nr:TonB-dependent receptor [Leptospira bouyouniensis]
MLNEIENKTQQKKNMRTFVLILTFLLPTYLFAQDENPKPDQDPKVEIQSKEETPTIRVKGKKETDREFLGDVEGTNIYSGKKNEVIRLDKVNGNLAMGNTRQVYAKVPGITIWENEGSGIQPGIGARGLSPNRNWEFNTRMNGHDIASDSFGYPEAYFNPPLEALEKVEIVRGAGALQYGPQFGGMVNYVVKKADPTRQVKVETKTTGGSFNTLNQYSSVSGTVGDWSYFVFYQGRSSDGWRNNSQYNVQTGFVNLAYKVSEKLKISFEMAKSTYESQQAGGLTDEQFRIDPRQSGRTRNWFSAPWNVPAMNIDYEQSPTARMNVKIFGLYGERNSVGVVSAANVADSIQARTLDYTPRQIDRDTYRNYGMEARQVFNYDLLERSHTLSFGGRYFNGNTDRFRNPNGTTGTKYDLRETNFTGVCYDGTRNCRVADLEFSTLNYAGFVENLFRITEAFSITPGVRYEWIRSTASGRVNESIPSASKPFGGMIQPLERIQRQVLYGLGAQYQTTKTTNLYANYSRAFRPVTYSELFAPTATLNDVDPNLKDQSGYNADAGYRGKFGQWIQFDMSVFELRYNNRVGQLPGLYPGQANFQTNVGDSLHRGVEAYLEIDPIVALTESQPYGSFSLFTSSANINARYIRWEDPRVLTNPTSAQNFYRVGKLVENAPSQIHRYGVTYHYKNVFSFTYLISYTGATYADAANTGPATANGQIGLIPSYTVRDFTFVWNFYENFSLRGGVNNMTNQMYFTRRASGYPGPGIMPGDGMFYFLGLSAVF